MFGLGVLTPLIARFRTLYPDIHVELILAEAQADLRQAQIDIDFRIAPPVEAGLKRRILFKSERHLVASPDYIASMPALTAPPQLADHALICYLKPGEGYVFRFLSDKGIDEVACTRATSPTMVLPSWNWPGWEKALPCWTTIR
ncbi:transcriptional regulator [Advenella kashmirensis WT001]|uniref:Transcriptional regulator n=2 Tax=Advenella kashmirensis TaxID=310575 RepID=I3UH54_ADVKW|nr:transcriptional regulator [Advenella kashmirensis WT001]